MGKDLTMRNFEVFFDFLVHRVDHDNKCQNTMGGNHDISAELQFSRLNAEKLCDENLEHFDHLYVVPINDALFHGVAVDGVGEY